MGSRRKHPGDGLTDIQQVLNAIEKRLFIGRLPEQTSEDELHRVFAEFGELTECRLVEKPHGKSVAFVGFAMWGAAHRALRATDGQLALEGHNAGQAIVASFAERTKNVGRGGGAHYQKGLDESRVFVGGLPEDVSDMALRELFEGFGQVEAVNLLPAKTEKRCGFVNFSLWGEALDAVEGLDNTPFPGRSPDEALTVVMAEPKDRTHDRPDSSGEPGAKRRRVDDHSSSGNSEFDRIKADYLYAVENNAPEGQCTELHWKLMASRKPWGGGGGWRSGGGGGGNQWAPEPRSSTPRGGSRRDGQGSGDPREDIDAARLFIGGLPMEVTDFELRALVEQLRVSGSREDTELLECRVLPGRGCGYLRFGSWRAAEQVVEALDDRTVNGWQKPLRAKWAVPKGGKEGGKGGGGGGSDWGGARALVPARWVGGGGGGRRDGGGSGEVDKSRLFVGQLVRGATNRDVNELFETFGKVTEFKYLEDKGICYVSYSDKRDAAAALESLNLKVVEGISRREGLNVQFSKPR